MASPALQRSASQLTMAGDRWAVDTVVGEPVTHQRAAFEAGRLDVV